MKIEIIIPAYNEEKRIGRTLEKYQKFYDSLVKKNEIDYGLLIVINNTRDKTEEIVEKFAKANKKIKYLNLKLGGKGYAIREGFKEVLKESNDLIGFVDADMATSPEAFYDLVKNVGKNDGVIASRYVKGAIVDPKQPITRIIVSRVFNFLVRSMFLMPYRDTQLGAKVFTRRALEKIVPDLNLTQWAFDVNLLYSARRKGMKIKEVKTCWRDQGLSKLKVGKASIQMFISIIRLRLMRFKFGERVIDLLRPVGSGLWNLLK